jgi:hypothetical protein
VKHKATIIVSGMIAADPWQGGATWAVLQYVLGLRRLRHEVYFIEPVPPKALRPAGSRLAVSDNARYFETVMTEFGLCKQAALLLAGSRETFGLDYDELERIARRADALVNISGMLTDETLISRIPVRAYLDIDPAFNQLWHAVQKIDMRFVGHTHHVTIGHNIGEPDCPVPTCGLKWLKTFQPVVLEHWPVVAEIKYNALTTIANWRGYGSIEHNGVTYGQKVHSLRQFITLPTLTTEKFLLALAIHPDETRDLVALKANGWQLLDPATVADTPASYQRFIQGSRAEFGIAKSGYAHSRCGWFSDRSLCYLASGRPVLAQDTGFGRLLPTGKGLFMFRQTDDCLQAIESLRSDYTRHAAGARAIAEEFFDSDKVLARLLRQIGL